MNFPPKPQLSLSAMWRAWCSCSAHALIRYARSPCNLTSCRCVKLLVAQITPILFKKEVILPSTFSSRYRLYSYPWTNWAVFPSGGSLTHPRKLRGRNLLHPAELVAYVHLLMCGWDMWIANPRWMHGLTQWQSNIIYPTFYANLAVQFVTQSYRRTSRVSRNTAPR